MTADSVAWHTMAGARESLFRLRIEMGRDLLSSLELVFSLQNKEQCKLLISGECRNDAWQGTIVNPLWGE
ncbi:hypothetical protein X798_08008 [Onchocerca flexuosa]|uniref:C2 domain-containing protein n=2 Tax=Onchocerca flexuosa TaxID=387005 RepID=A0A183HAI6_9BILA|nr:hypothetical protein X798_08008 [Onchocerca flexuosa]VDO40162.1 unnamed protein product [Onchocerca flexuosa]